jgi:hypothetical protein
MKRKKVFMSAGVIAIVTLGLVMSHGGLLTSSIANSQEPELIHENDQQMCESYLADFEYMRKHIYCQDINVCSEPCWQEDRKLIIRCLQLKGEQATEEKIQYYLDAYPSPAFFEKSRKLCLIWGKTEEERQKCIHGYSSVCLPQ